MPYDVDGLAAPRRLDDQHLLRHPLGRVSVAERPAEAELGPDLGLVGLAPDGHALVVATKAHRELAVPAAIRHERTDPDDQRGSKYEVYEEKKHGASDSRALRAPDTEKQTPRNATNQKPRRVAVRVRAPRALKARE